MGRKDKKKAAARATAARLAGGQKNHSTSDENLAGKITNNIEVDTGFCEFADNSFMGTAHASLDGGIWVGSWSHRCPSTG